MCGCVAGPVGYPFFGNLNSILKEDLPQYLQRLGKIYGPAFKASQLCILYGDGVGFQCLSPMLNTANGFLLQIWFGNYPFVIINDPDLAR